MSDDLRAHLDALNAARRGRDGSLARDIGAYQAVLVIEDPMTVRLTFTGADGRPLRTVPGALKVPFAAEIRELKSLVRQVCATLAADHRISDETVLARIKRGA